LVLVLHLITPYLFKFQQTFILEQGVESAFIFYELSFQDFMVDKADVFLKLLSAGLKRFLVKTKLAK